MRHDEQIRQIKVLLAHLDAGTNVDAGGLRRNPTSVYVDADLAEQEWESFFRSHPQMIGLSGDLPEPGSFLTMDELPAVEKHGLLRVNPDPDGAIDVDACSATSSVTSWRAGTSATWACSAPTTTTWHATEARDGHVRRDVPLPGTACPRGRRGIHGKRGCDP